MKARVLFVAGVFCGVAAVVACHHTGTAGASPSDCATWQVAIVNGTQGCDVTIPLGTACTIPTGWEPFAMNGTAVMVRRCAP
jgi:hypothetical protein